MKKISLLFLAFSFFFILPSSAANADNYTLKPPKKIPGLTTKQILRLNNLKQELKTVSEQMKSPTAPKKELLSTRHTLLAEINRLNRLKKQPIEPNNYYNDLEESINAAKTEQELKKLLSSYTKNKKETQQEKRNKAQQTKLGALSRAIRLIGERLTALQNEKSTQKIIKRAIAEQEAQRLVRQQEADALLAETIAEQKKEADALLASRRAEEERRVYTEARKFAAAKRLEDLELNTRERYDPQQDKEDFIVILNHIAQQNQNETTEAYTQRLQLHIETFKKQKHAEIFINGKLKETNLTLDITAFGINILNQIITAVREGHKDQTMIDDLIREQSRSLIGDSALPRL